MSIVYSDHDAENMKLSLYEPQTKLRFELTFSGAVCLRAAWRACMGPGVSGHGQTGGAERLERPTTRGRGRLPETEHIAAREEEEKTGLEITVT